MTVWLFPAALAGLAATLGPLIVHLLRRQRARRLVVPTVRFIPAADQSVVRIRTPADVPLLLVRMGIIACAALALARPLFLTDGRAAGWAERIARVVVVDTSDPNAVAATGEAAAAELRSAALSRRMDASSALEPALRRAAAWLATAPPARREIVVLSEFRQGSIDGSAFARLPENVGIRLVPIAADNAMSVRLDAGAVLGDRDVFDRQARIDATSTSAAFMPRSTKPAGLRLLTRPADAKDVEALLRIVSRAGAAAPSADQPIVIRFAGGPSLPAAGQQPPGSWAAGAALRLLRHPDASRLPLRAALGEDGELLVDTDAAPGTLPAAEILKAVLDARPEPHALERHEVARIPPETLAGWNRPPGPADTTAWRQSDESDGRWFWLAALLLLGLESWMRRGQSSAAAPREVDAHAA